ncbi:cobyrinic acid a,c-diamide synthase [Methanobrevibacter arboriphilus]|jgi:cobyric acid synthase|uniref:Cobyrinic acid a,c-diamide synthase n=2 Tax=Methanobrevibacter arboriphilus TaxID=39441 RepID=A0ACA8R480_METAZ|nr:AAA family ATPase [Methanobrevibacter arboriphilus]BBL62087.1 cobyrinic acid a,c-diamide synthase [Methanobrevibacter arboriphilus]GLI11881.1 cobyrinic acid a,c-diamide synthase [Methanobrevibacter arboriphilus]
MKIGLVYVKGALPGFEDFGNLPTDIVKSNGLIKDSNALKASEELDAIIIPGGSLLESNSVSTDLANEITKMAYDEKPVIGICSGFQLLANETDVGRRSPCPIIKKGLGLLDVNFSPLISNDRINAVVSDNNNSFFTKNITPSDFITGFHCHTYGKIEIIDENYDNGSKDENTIKNNFGAKPLHYSKIKRMNYGDTDSSILSGVSNDNGNVIGTMIHGILDENPVIVDNILDYIGANYIELDNIFKVNEELKKFIKSELAIDTGINTKNINRCNEFRKIIISSINNKITNFKETNSKDINFYNLDSFNKEIPPTLMIGSTGSDSGKTFIVSGITGALTKKGLNVAVLKVGPDVRDIEPSLYLTKNKMEDYSSIKIGHIGWMDIEETLKRLKNSNYDFVIIEGVMSVFTGILNEKIPYSGAEIAVSSNIPILMVSGVNKGGIESAAVDLVSHTNKLKELGINVNGILLNKVYDENIFNNVSKFIATETGLSKEDILYLPKIKMDARSTTPEVEIKLEEFSKYALKTVESYLDLEKIVKMADIPGFKGYLSFDDIKKFF